MSDTDSSLSTLSPERGDDILPANLVIRKGKKGRRRLIDKISDQLRQETPMMSNSSQESADSVESNSTAVQDSDDPRGVFGECTSDVFYGSQERPSVFDDMLANSRASMMAHEPPGDDDDEFLEGPGRRIMQAVDREDEGYVIVYQGLRTGVPLFLDELVSEG
jgi:hypothetical protein